MNRFTPAVLVLLVANVLLFLAGAFQPTGKDWMILKGAFWSVGNENSAIWQPVTYMFLHGTVGHLIFNMFALVSFGVHLEGRWGTLRFLLFYCLCGIGAALVHNGVNLYHFQGLHDRLVAGGVSPDDIASMLVSGREEVPLTVSTRAMMQELYQIYSTPMIGASGAIYGVLVAFGIMYPNAKLALLFVPVPIAAKFMIPALLALDLLSGVTGFSLFGGGIAHFAHIGGALIGFFLMLLWRRRSPQDRAIG